MQDVEGVLDEQLARMSSALQLLADDQLNRSLLYVTNDDITALPCFAPDTLFAVKAPDAENTTMEVPDPLERESAHAHGAATGAEGGQEGQLHYR